MSANFVLLNGRLPRFEPTYNKGEGDKKSYLAWSVSVKRDYKKPDEQYYPEDLIRFKLFGAKADFLMNNFSQGDGVILQGKLQVEDDYEKNGETVKGQMVFMVDSVMFPDGKMAENNGGAKASTSKTISKPGASPAKPKASVPGKPGMPKAPGAPATFGNRPKLPGVR